jgi:hypothetical protein
MGKIFTSPKKLWRVYMGEERKRVEKRGQSVCSFSNKGYSGTVSLLEVGLDVDQNPTWIGVLTIPAC